MAIRHVIMADPQGLAVHVRPLLAQLSSHLELVAVPDGARCITAHAKLCRAKRPALIVVLYEELTNVSGQRVGATIRSVESALGTGSSAIIYVSDSDDANRLTGEWGRAVPLKPKTDDSPEERSKRLIRAIAKILSQLKQKSKS